MKPRPARRVVPLGDSAVLVVLGKGVDEAVNRRVHRLAAEIARLRLADPRFGHPVPAYASVLVPVDPLDPGVEAAVPVLEALLTSANDEPVEPDGPGELIELPTRYGGHDGPDLDEVAAIHGLRPTHVVELHASVEYRAYFLGFSPGFAYLGRLPDAIATPRLATPRARVPAGSVAIAGEQTAVYPFETPGGWRLIGRTEVPVWDVSADPPARIRPGARVRFVPLPG